MATWQRVPRPAPYISRAAYPFAEALAAAREDGGAVRFPVPEGSTVARVARALWSYLQRTAPTYRGHVRRDGDWVVVWVEPKEQEATR